MFNSVIDAPALRERRLGTGAIISGVTHAVIFAVIVYGTAHKTHAKVAPTEVSFRVAAPPPPPPPPPPPGGAVRPVTPKKPVVAKNDIVVTKDQTKPVPTQEPPPEAPAEPGGDPDGVPGGEPGGVPGGVIGGVIGGNPPSTATAPPPPPPPPPVNAVLPFGEGMNRPTFVAGPRPDYTRQAREARVEGTMLVKCVITTQGTLRNCRIIKSLPFMDQPVLEALASQRYTPVTFQGRPVDVEYVIPFKFTLQ